MVYNTKHMIQVIQINRKTNIKEKGGGGEKGGGEKKKEVTQ